MKYLTYVFLAGLMTLVLACGVSTEDIDATVQARIASIPTPTPQIVIQEVEVVVEKVVIQEVIKEIEVPVEVTVVVEKLVEIGATVGETFTDDDGNFGLKFSSHSGYEKHVNYYDQNEHNYSYISDININYRIYKK